jgi:hypothetical protein
MKTKPTYKESPSSSDSPYFADNDKSVRKPQQNKAKRESRQARRRREIEREWNHRATFAYLNRRAAYWMERALKAENKLKEREVAENELAESLHRALCGNSRSPSRSPSPSPQSSVTSELPLDTTFTRSNNVSPTSASSEVFDCDVTAIPFKEFFPELAPFWKRVIARNRTGSVMVEDGYDVLAYAPYDGNSFSTWLESVVRTGFANEQFWEDLKNPALKMAVQNHRRPPNDLYVQRPDCPDLTHFWQQES